MCYRKRNQRKLSSQRINCRQRTNPCFRMLSEAPGFGSLPWRHRPLPNLVAVMKTTDDSILTLPLSHQVFRSPSRLYLRSAFPKVCSTQGFQIFHEDKEETGRCSVENPASTQFTRFFPPRRHSLRWQCSGEREDADQGWDLFQMSDLQYL